MLNTYSRDKLIQLLIDHDLHRFDDYQVQADHWSFLLRVGFVGYENQTDQELIDDCIDRELNFEENANA